jgi:hypothetical protein
MVQVFGNRIIGGVGAPDPRMSEAFGAGVNTALSQRESRQGMRLRDIDLQFKIEDREEAKRRRAAADAAAGAARAKAAALNEQYMKIFGAGAGAARVPGLNLPTTEGTGRDRQGPAAAPTTTTAPTPAAPAPRAGVQRQPLTFGGTTVAGGAGSGSIGGGPGTDRLGVPTAVPAPAPVEAPGASEFVVTPATEGMLPDYVEAPGLWSAIAGAPAGAANADTLLREGWINGFEYQQLVRGSRGQQQDVLANVGRRKAGTEVPFFTPETATAVQPGVTPPTTTTPTPAIEAAAPSTGSVSVTMPDGSTLPLSTGTPVSAQPTQLTFGPRLGAMPQTQEELMIDDFVRTQPARGTAAPPPPRMGEPGAPNRAITQLLAQRDQQAQWAQALIAAGQYADAQAVQTEIMNIDTKLEAAVGRLALNEAVMFNAPQRLNAVWSDISGQQYEFIPTAQGGFDVYVNGELLDQNLPMDVIEANTLSMTDQVYAAQQSELATLTATERAKGMGQAEANIYEYEQKAAIDVDKALQVGLTEIDLLAMKRDLGFGDQDQIDFQKDENTGIILVLRNGALAGQYAPMTTTGPTGEAVTRYELIQ